MADEINPSGGTHISGDVNPGADFIGRDKITIHLTYPAAPFRPDDLDLRQTRTRYLQALQEHTTRLDFKGLRLIETIEKASGLSLEDVYVPLRARPDRPESETWPRTDRIAGRMLRGEEGVEEAPPTRNPAEPVPLDTALNKYPAVVVLGDPGSGKSTLLKMLALSLARQTDGLLPILVPLNAYADELSRNGPVGLYDFLPKYFSTRYGTLHHLGALFTLALEQGQAVVLLDGLDEVQTDRAYLVGLVEAFVRETVPPPCKDEKPPPGNRVVVSSRFVGYREAPLTDPRWTTFALVDWEEEEIRLFTARWTLAVEAAMAGGVTPTVESAARREQGELLAAILGNPGIQHLAGNPLLLTLLALIKRQGVTLPHRRVELYELYLQTLLRDWRTARTMDKKPVGPALEYLDAVNLLAPLAFWLRENNPQAGLIPEPQLRQFLAEYFQREEGFSPRESRDAARDFLLAVHQYTNLLLERGRGQYGFIHLTFEEYLAGKRLAQMDPATALQTYLAHLDDPGWHETLLLGVGALGIVNQFSQRAGELLEKLLDAEVPTSQQGLNTLLAGEALRDVEKTGVGGRAARRITNALIDTMQNAEMPAKHRQQAGRILGDIGWLPEDLDAFVEIPAGSFLYGDDKISREIPYRYWMGKYPVTNYQFARFIEAGGYAETQWWSEEGWKWRVEANREQPAYWQDAEENNPLFPVNGVSWYEAEAYANWLNAQLLAFPIPKGYVVRLPTEEEWERAARGTDGREYPWGDKYYLAFVDSLCDHSESEHGFGTNPICMYSQKISPTGVWDMSDNVAEWTNSWDKQEKRRILRGGSWFDDHRLVRCASQDRHHPGYFSHYAGIRVVISPLFVDG